MRTNGLDRHKSTPRGVTVTTLKRRAAAKPLMTTDAAEPAATVRVQNGATFQAVFSLNATAWQVLGQPTRVDVMARLDQGFEIKPGDAYACRADGRRFQIAVTASKVGLSGVKRDVITLKVTAQAIPRALILAAPPAAWIGAAPQPATAPPRPADKPAVAAPPPPAEPARVGRVLPDLATPREPITEVTGRVGVAFRTNGTGSFQVAFTVPLTLLGEIGDPERVVITGNAHEGYAIRKVPQGGVKVAYASRSNAYLTKGSKDENLTREVRDTVWVAARVQGGAIRLVPPSQDWVLGGKTVAPPLAAAAVSNGQADVRLPANPMTAPLPRMAPSEYAVTATSSLRMQYEESRVRLLDLKRALEAQMNSELKCGPGLRLVVAEN